MAVHSFTHHSDGAKSLGARIPNSFPDLAALEPMRQMDDPHSTGHHFCDSTREAAQCLTRGRTRITNGECLLRTRPASANVRAIYMCRWFACVILSRSREAVPVGTVTQPSPHKPWAIRPPCFSALRFLLSTRHLLAPTHTIDYRPLPAPRPKKTNTTDRSSTMADDIIQCDSFGDCYSSGRWHDWGRWVFVTLMIIGFLMFVAILV